jgi:hypothetical protein
MTLDRVSHGMRAYGTQARDVWHATRRREGLGTIVAVVVISALLIVGLSYVLEAPTSNEGSATPPATYRAQ